MKVITQKNETVEVKGDVEMKGNKILFQNKILGEYSDMRRTCDVFAELTCHSWNHKGGIFSMPTK